MTSSLDGKVAIVTGAGRGLGEVTCEVLGEQGVNVVCADIRQELCQSVAALLCRKGFRAQAFPLDVSDPSSAQKCVEAVYNQYGRLDILINGAAIDMTLPIDEISAEDWSRILQVNLMGPFFMSKYALCVMKTLKSGHIVNIASTASKRAWANASAYHASKWGLVGFSHAMHVEARENGIKVTAIIAGGMRTPFLLERFPDIDPGILQDPRHVANAIKFVLCQPEETVIPELMVVPLKEKSWP